MPFSLTRTKSAQVGTHCQGSELGPRFALTITIKVENFPGFADGIQVSGLVDAISAQASRFGAVDGLRPRGPAALRGGTWE